MNSSVNNSGQSGPTGLIINLIQDLMAIHNVTKFGADWSIFADASI